MPSKSVNLHQCLERLEEHCAVELPDKALLLSFKDQRNPIEHFELNHSREALEASSAIVLGALVDFIGEAYDEDDLSQRCLFQYGCPSRTVAPGHLDGLSPTRANGFRPTA
jgi:hypothetical protein